MTTAIDTNIIIALWDRDASLSSAGILADFMIGAHAETRGYHLLT